MLVNELEVLTAERPTVGQLHDLADAIENPAGDSKAAEKICAILEGDVAPNAGSARSSC